MFSRINFNNDDFAYHQFFMSKFTLCAVYYAEGQANARTRRHRISDIFNNRAVPEQGGVKLNDLY
jgi:hypothetical protein